MSGSDLERRVGILEEQIANYSNRIANLEANDQFSRDAIAVLQGDVANLLTTTSMLQADLTALRTDLAALRQEMSKS